MIDHALEVQADDPATAGALWTEVDRTIVNQAPFCGSLIVSPSTSSPNAWAIPSRAFRTASLLNQLWVR